MNKSMMILDYSINEHNGSIGEDLEANAFQVQAQWLPESKHPHLTCLYEEAVVVCKVQIQMKTIKTRLITELCSEL